MVYYLSNYVDYLWELILSGIKKKTRIAGCSTSSTECCGQNHKKDNREHWQKMNL